MEIIPVHSHLLTETWPIVNKHHIYEADALQIASSKHCEADILLTADKELVKASNLEGVKARNIERDAAIIQKDLES